MTEPTRACGGGGESRRKRTCPTQGEHRSKASYRYADTVGGGTQAPLSPCSHSLRRGEAELSRKPRYWRNRVALQGGPQPPCLGNESRLRFQLRCLPWFAASQVGSLTGIHCCLGAGWEALCQSAPKARPVLQEETASQGETTSG